ncbi:MAG TPA: ATPase domain-containing protein [Thermoplasmata archaeon]|nr:ATPase domain-containing protein [Thermoplasmata archaeon]
MPQSLMNDGATEGATAPSSSLRSVEAGALAKALGVGTDTADTLVQAGYTSAEAVRGMSESALEQLGVATADVERIRHPPEGAHAADPNRAAEQDRIVERWAGSVRKADRSRKRKVTIPSKDSADTLRKWVDGDDGALEEWIASSEPVRPAPFPAAPAPTPPPGEEPYRGGPTESVPAPVLEREETVVRWLTGLLDRVKTDQFDPSSLIQETQELHRQLYDERTKRKQLEEEVEHVKRGSIAVIKYVRSHEAKEREIAVRSKEDEIAELKLRLLALEHAGATVESAAAPVPGTAPPRATADAVEKATRELDARLREEFSEREHGFIERETDLRRRTVQIESELRNVRAELERTQTRGELLTQGQAASAEVERRLQEFDQRERDLVARENELRTRFEEIRIKTDEIDRRRAPLEARERDLTDSEQQLEVRRQALDAEARRLEEMRSGAQANGATGAAEEGRAAALFVELKAKEEELRVREMTLKSRLAEVERMAAAVKAGEPESAAEAGPGPAEVRVKSGIRRLDDLLYGGYPVSAQILVNGPAHTGKDILARFFSVEGLKNDIPSIWVVTDSTWTQVRDDLAGLYPKYAEAEKAGMIRFVDLYSRNVMSSPTAVPGVRLLSSTDKGVLDQLTQSVNSISEELREKHPTYRLIFESVSSLTAYLDTSATFRFLQPFIGRRKIDQAVAYYELDRGMHSDSDLETLEHMVDGSINTKIEQLKTFLSVKGIGETQSRAWIGYTFTKRALNLGSFSLDHIR